MREALGIKKEDVPSKGDPEDVDLQEKFNAEDSGESDDDADHGTLKMGLKSKQVENDGFGSRRGKIESEQPEDGEIRYSDDSDSGDRNRKGGRANKGDKITTYRHSPEDNVNVGNIKRNKSEIPKSARDKKLDDKGRRYKDDDGKKHQTERFKKGRGATEFSEDDSDDGYEMKRSLKYSEKHTKGSSDSDIDIIDKSVQRKLAKTTTKHKRHYSDSDSDSGRERRKNKSRGSGDINKKRNHSVDSESDVDKNKSGRSQRKNKINDSIRAHNFDESDSDTDIERERNQGRIRQDHQSYVQSNKQNKARNHDGHSDHGRLGKMDRDQRNRTNDTDDESSDPDDYKTKLRKSTGNKEKGKQLIDIKNRHSRDDHHLQTIPEHNKLDKDRRVRKRHDSDLSSDSDKAMNNSRKVVGRVGRSQHKIYSSSDSSDHSDKSSDLNSSSSDGSDSSGEEVLYKSKKMIKTNQHKFSTQPHKKHGYVGDVKIETRDHGVGGGKDSNDYLENTQQARDYDRNEIRESKYGSRKVYPTDRFESKKDDEDEGTGKKNRDSEDRMFDPPRNFKSSRRSNDNVAKKATQTSPINSRSREIGIKRNIDHEENVLDHPRNSKASRRSYDDVAKKATQTGHIDGRNKEDDIKRTAYPDVRRQRYNEDELQNDASKSRRHDDRSLQHLDDRYDARRERYNEDDQQNDGKSKRHDDSRSLQCHDDRYDNRHKDVVQDWDRYDGRDRNNKRVEEQDYGARRKRSDDQPGLRHEDSKYNRAYNDDVSRERSRHNKDEYDSRSHNREREQDNGTNKRRYDDDADREHKRSRR